MTGQHFTFARRTGALAEPGPGRRSLDLFDELDASYRRTADPRAWDWRERTGWPMGATGYGLGGGVARIAFAGDGTYEPSGREGVGTAALIIPAWSGPAPSSPDTLVDLLAWVPATGALIPRLGLAAVLGEWAIRRAEMEPEPSLRRLVIYRDVLEWARAGCEPSVWRYHRGGHGIVVLDWRRLRSEIGHLAGEGVEMVAPDLATGRRLRAALEPPAQRKPRILIAEHPAEVAA